jgi:hypothetical protein
MRRIFHFAVRCLLFIAGLLGIWFGVRRWLWYQTLPRHAPARFCGNCFLAAVGVPVELGLVGMLLALIVVFNVRPRSDDFYAWLSIAIAIVAKPSVIWHHCSRLPF